MEVVDAARLSSVLTPALVIEALREGFSGGITTPLRHHHTIQRPAETATLLLMPAWHDMPAAQDAGRGRIGVKIVSVFPDNARRAHPTIQGSYLLLSGATGAPLALMDGPALTLWRTAAASALAAGYLARASARRLVMVGAGSLAPYLIAAHRAVRPVTEVAVWNRDHAKARKLAADLAGTGIDIAAAEDLEAAVREADIVSAATLARDPLIRGDWLRPGTHVDLVGGFTRDMREADDAAIRRAAVFVDTREGACREAGDIVRPLESGVIAPGDIRADLFDLCRGRHAGRENDGQITLFKSVGTALEDLALASLVHDRLTQHHVRET